MGEQFVLQTSLQEPKQTEDLLNMQTAIYLTVAAVAVAAAIAALFFCKKKTQMKLSYLQPKGTI